MSASFTIVPASATITLPLGSSGTMTIGCSNTMNGRFGVVGIAIALRMCLSSFFLSWLIVSVSVASFFPLRRARPSCWRLPGSFACLDFHQARKVKPSPLSSNLRRILRRFALGSLRNSAFA